jgi:hypothetical protein
VRWGDLNGDGKDDYFCIGPKGDMYASINQGWSGSESDGPVFKDIGLVKVAVAGYDQAKVRLGDIDGDGRVDYCVVGTDGGMYFTHILRILRAFIPLLTAHASGLLKSSKLTWPWGRHLLLAERRSRRCAYCSLQGVLAGSQ